MFLSTLFRSGRPAPRPYATRFRPRLDALEPRDVPAVYMCDSEGDLFTVNPGDGSVDPRGRMREVMNDLAVDPGGGLWGVSREGKGHFRGLHTSLFRIDPQNARITLVGRTGFFVGLGFRGSELFAATTVGVPSGTGIYRVSTADASSELVYNVPTPGTGAGDLAFDEAGNLYLSARTGDIVRVNSDATGRFTGHDVIGLSIPGLTNMDGLVYSGGSLYAFNTDPATPDGVEKIYRINPGTGDTTADTTEIATIESGLVQLVTGAASAPPSAARVAAGPLSSGSVGEPQSLAAFGEHPEGIAFDRHGTMYVGMRTDDLAEGGLLTSRVLKVSPGGRVSVLATLPATDDVEANGVLGLATDRDGTVYAAHDTRKRESKGIWRIDRDGSTARLPGSERMEFPNALTFDEAGVLYATDSTGSIWRFGPGGTGRAWLEDELLEPYPEFDPLGFPLPGANGIAFYPDPTPRLYVANTEKGLLLEVPIGPDGRAGAAVVVAGDPDPETLFVNPLFTIDGIAVDVTGDVHAVVPGAVLLSGMVPGVPRSPVVRIDPDTGAVAFTVAPEDFDKFDVPLSLAFSTRPGERGTIYVTNGDLFSDPFGPGPSVVGVTVGVAGYSPW